MKGKRYSEEQVIRILKEIDSGKAVKDVCREHGVSEQTVYRWRNKYADSGGKRSVVPMESDHRFRRKVITHSDSK